MTDKNILDKLTKMRDGLIKQKNKPHGLPPEVQRFITDITSKSSTLKAAEEVDFLRRITKDKPLKLIEDKKVMETLKKSVPSLAASEELFNHLMNEIIESKKKKK